MFLKSKQTAKTNVINVINCQTFQTNNLYKLVLVKVSISDV